MKNDTSDAGLSNASGEFCRYFGIERMSDAFWTPKIAKGGKTGGYYAWEIKFQAGDSEGWMFIGSTFEEAVSRLNRYYRKGR